jgi:hypothetical protein
VWGVATFGLLTIGLLAVAYLQTEPAADVGDAVGGIALLLSLVAFVLSGAFIVSRQPDNVIGWLLILPGLALPLNQLATIWLAGLDPPPIAMTPGLWLLLWVVDWSWILVVFPLFHLLLTFPNGRLLSSRWRWAVGLELALMVVAMAIAGLTEAMGPAVNEVKAWSLPNPVGVLPAGLMDAEAGLAWGIGLLTITVLSAIAVAVRFRRGGPDEREQLKWPLSGAVVFGAMWLVAVTSSDTNDVLLGFGLAAIPVSVAIAITRYHLYAIDRIIGRTVSYGLITVILAVAFLGTNLALQTALDRGATFEVAISTLVVAMLFQPLRRAIQRPIDRRFNRARVDAERTVMAFAARTRDQMDLPALAGELSRTAGQAVQPTSSAIWIRGAVGGAHLAREATP